MRDQKHLIRRPTHLRDHITSIELLLNEPPRQRIQRPLITKPPQQRKLTQLRRNNPHLRTRRRKTHPTIPNGITQPPVHPINPTRSLNPRQHPQQPPRSNPLHLRHRLSRRRQITRRRRTQTQRRTLLLHTQTRLRRLRHDTHHHSVFVPTKETDGCMNPRSLPPKKGGAMDRISFAPLLAVDITLRIPLITIGNLRSLLCVSPRTMCALWSGREGHAGTGRDHGGDDDEDHEGGQRILPVRRNHGGLGHGRVVGRHHRRRQGPRGRGRSGTGRLRWSGGRSRRGSGRWRRWGGRRRVGGRRLRRRRSG